jgi:hypothetical protein
MERFNWSKIKINFNKKSTLIPLKEDIFEFEYPSNRRPYWRKKRHFINIDDIDQNIKVKISKSNIINFKWKTTSYKKLVCFIFYLQWFFYGTCNNI